jgi:Melibiase
VDNAATSVNIGAMDRRTFILLSGATSGALLRGHPATPAGKPGARRAGGRLAFTLDEEQRWTLSYHDGGAPVPLVEGAELAVHLDQGWVPLGTLADLTTRRGIGPDAPLVVSGSAGGMVVEAAFVDAPPAALAAITVTVSPDRTRGVVHGLRYFALPADALLPGPGRLQAFVNGYQSWSECTVSVVDDRTPPLASHGAASLTRGRRSLALFFDTGEPGEAAVRIAAGTVDARSDWLPSRPLRLGGDAATLRFAFQPTADPLTPLETALAPRPADLDRFAAGAPAGWCSWYQLYDKVTEAAVLGNVDLLAATVDPRDFRYIQVDDGYQRAAGDWSTNDRFAHGHRWLTDRIRAAGFLAGLWLAPFAVGEASGIPATHPEWLLTTGGTPLVMWTHAAWGGRIYALDGSHPEVQAWLRRLGRRVVGEWGYDYLKIDFLYFATQGEAHWGGATHAEAYRAGVAALREGLGPEPFLLGCGAPLQHAVGAVDGMRIGEDVEASWEGIQGPARAAARREFYHRAAWFNDPDCLVVRPPLSLDEARVWAAIVAISGGCTVWSDDLRELPPDRLALLTRTIPPVAARGRATDVTATPLAHSPTIATDLMNPISIGGPWRFAIGDDPDRAQPAYDDSAWETMPVPATWETAGHPGYDGFAWYRTRFTLPLPSPELLAGEADPPAHLDLGRIDDVDETFLNGTKLGQRGAFPPEYRSAWRTFRRYPIPAGALRWGADNVLAIRVFDGDGDGGFWSVQRDVPPARWIVQGAPGWWTVALVNWEDEPRRVRVPLADLGITAPSCDVYDVWAEEPRPRVQGAIAEALAPHSALVVALRVSASCPQVIGTTRHIVQGAIDLAAEHWDAATRTLQGRATRLDRRGYRVTLAVPPGLRATDVAADLPATLRTLRSGDVVVEWPEGTGGHDVAWRVTFR